MDYVDLVLEGLATIDEIDYYIEKWHEDKSVECELYDYLGMTESEYFDWVRDPDYIHEILLRRKNLIDAVNKYRKEPALFVEEFLNIILYPYQKIMLNSWYKLKR